MRAGRGGAVVVYIMLGRGRVIVGKGPSSPNLYGYEGLAEAVHFTASPWATMVMVKRTKRFIQVFIRWGIVILRDGSAVEVLNGD